MQKHSQTTLYHFIEIRFADPITAIGLGDKYIVIGSIMGRITAFSIADKQSIIISEFSNENITGILIENQYTFTVAIGDEEYVKYRLASDETGQVVPDYIRFKNYDNEYTHKNFCESSFTYLSSENLIIVNMIMPNESNLHIESAPTNIKVIFFKLFNNLDEEYSHKCLIRFYNRYNKLYSPS